MFKKLIILIILALCSFNMALGSTDQDSDSKELSGLITSIFKGINVTRTEAETAAEDIVKEVEAVTGLTKNKYISKLVHNVFSSLNSVIEKVVDIAGKDNDSMNKRDLKDNFENLKNQASILSSKISSIGNIAKLPNDLTKILTGIIGNINIILDTVTVRIRPLVEVSTNSKRQVEIESNITTTASTTTNKYQKLAEYYKNKYAGKYLNMADEVEKESNETKRDLNNAIFDLKNQTTNLSSRIIGLTNLNKLPQNIAMLLTGIFKNINVILDKIESNVSGIVSQVVYQKRDQKNGSDNLIEKLIKMANNVVEKITDKIVGNSDKDLSKRQLEEEATTTAEPTTTIESLNTTTNKYQKLAEFYKNKYAGKYLNKE